MTALRRSARTAAVALAALVALGVWVQVYLAASSLFGADALESHQSIGWIVHTMEIVVFLAALVAWADKRLIGLAAALFVLGTGQVLLSGGDKWVGGLHGMFALLVLTLAVLIVQRGRTPNAPAV
jgi:hypothetical protein